MLYDVYNDYSDKDFEYYEPLKFNYLKSKPKFNIDIPLGSVQTIRIPLNVGIRINPQDIIITQQPSPGLDGDSIISNATLADDILDLDNVDFDEEEDVVEISTITTGPTEGTAAEKGARAYNLYTMESWLCTDYQKINDRWVFTWEKDEYMFINETGPIFCPFPDSFYEGKTVCLNIYNFRYELLTTINFPKAAKDIYLTIDKHLIDECFSSRGTYRCEVILNWVQEQDEEQEDEQEEEIPVLTRDYNELINKPQIENVTLEGDKTFEELGLHQTTPQEIDDIIFN